MADVGTHTIPVYKENYIIGRSHITVNYNTFRVGELITNSFPEGVVMNIFVPYDKPKKSDLFL